MPKSEPVESTVVNEASALITITPEQLAIEAQNLINRLGSMGGGDVVKFENKNFVFPDGVTVSSEMDAVIVDFAYVNQMFRGNFDRKNPSAPICAAVGLDQDHLVPFEHSPERQSDSCIACPMNQYGSAGNGKACKNGVWLAVIAANATDDSPMYIMKLSPTAITPFKRYVANTISTFQTPTYGVVTHFEFDPKETYPKVLCSNPDRKRNQNLEQALKRRAEAAARLTQTINFTSA